MKRETEPCHIQKPKLWVNVLMVIILCAICIASMVFSVAKAAPPAVDPRDFGSTSSGFHSFYTSIKSGIQKVTKDSELNNVSLMLWKFFSVVLLIMTVVRFAMHGFDFYDLFFAVFMISITRVLMLDYDMITSALWGWSEGFATGIQKAGLGASDAFFLPRYLWNLMTNFSTPSDNFLFSPLKVMASIILALLGSVVCVLGFFASVWGLYGYSLAKMIGFMFIPTLLFERLSWLFDGWVRFFFGFLIYNVIARANLMLVVIALSSFFKLSTGTPPQNSAWAWEFNSLLDLMGVLVFLSMAIIGLLSTGSFVSSIVSGSSVGSVSGGLRKLRTAFGK
jgi:hypothetical protein